MITRRLRCSAYLFYLNTATASETSGSSAPEGRSATVGELVFFAITSLRSLVGLLVGSRNNFGGKSKVRTEVFDTLVGEVAVVVLPREGNTDVFLGCKRLHQHKNLQVARSLDVGVLLGLGVFLDDADSLLEEVRVDSDTVFFGDPHGATYL